MDLIAKVYGSVIEAGLFKADSIKVAEAAKVIENTQRDLNIALMNELSVIFDMMGIETNKVLEAAGTKWNFLKFFPGLVGGHCIGVDPYYLTYKAEEIGYHPEVILAGRRINDSMGSRIAQKTIKLMIQSGKKIKGAKVLVMGLTFKEDVADFRNSRVVDIITELRDYGVEVLAHDPHVKKGHTPHGFDIKCVDLKGKYDAAICAVGHKAYSKISVQKLHNLIKGPKRVFIDVKAAFEKKLKGHKDFAYWKL